MSPTAWLGRVSRMPRAEIWFRARTAARAEAGRLASTFYPETWQRARLAGRLEPMAGPLAVARERLEARDWMGAHAALASHFVMRRTRFLLSPDTLPALVDRLRRRFPGSVSEARAAGHRLLDRRFDLLGHGGLSFESSARGRGAIDWHFDPVHGRRMPLSYWSQVRYLDPGNGDHKIVWELNRHQHWLALGRAAWLTGDSRYRDEFVRQLESWLLDNPPLTGANWASPLELSLRSLSWLWALHLFVNSPGGTAADRRSGIPWIVDVLLGLDRQLSHVEQNLSRYFSPNTHLTGEALGLYVCGLALPELSGARRWVETGRSILLQEAGRQVCRDGGHAERATLYHRYTLDFYLLALAMAQVTEDGCADALAEVVDRLAGAARLLADDRGRLPLIGDDDGGRLFRMFDGSPADVTTSLATAAVLLDEPDLALGPSPEETWWFTGVEPRPPRDPVLRPRDRVQGRRCESGALPDTGYYVSRRGAGHHLVIDGGPHGYLNGGHAHADALSVTLTVSGRPLLIDPGTVTYTMSREVRDRFRSSQMHNTLTVDDRSTSIPKGPFHWASTADARVECWATEAAFDFFAGTVETAPRLVHRRRVVSLPGDLLVVLDSVLGAGAHDLAAHWHLAPGWMVEGAARRSLRLTHRDDGSAWLASTAAVLELFEGDDTPGLGWSSPAYGAIVPSLTVRATTRRATPASLATVVGGGSLPPDLSVQALDVTRSPGLDTMVVRLAAGGRVYLLAFSEPGAGWAASDGCGLAWRGPFALVQLTPGGDVVRMDAVEGGHVTMEG